MRMSTICSSSQGGGLCRRGRRRPTAPRPHETANTSSVSEGGLEPPRPNRAPGPQPGASANSATPTWPPGGPGQADHSSAQVLSTQSAVAAPAAEEDAGQPQDGQADDCRGKALGERGAGGVEEIDRLGFGGVDDADRGAGGAVEAGVRGGAAGARGGGGGGLGGGVLQAAGGGRALGGDVEGTRRPRTGAG